MLEGKSSKVMDDTNVNKFSDVVSRWAGWALAHPDLGFQLNLFQQGRGQIMPTTLLLAHPDLKT